MRWKYYTIFLSAIVFVSAAGCAKKAPSDGTVLARVSNRAITMDEFNKRIEKLPAYYKDIANRNKKRFLDDMIAETLFYEEAIRKGVDRDKEAKDVINEAKKKILVAKLIKAEVEDKVTVSDAEMRAFYEANKERFKTVEMWRASHILVSTEAEAKSALAELARGAKFEDLAKARSIDATASRGGDIGYFRAGQLVPEFEKEALALKVGEMSGIVHTQFGYHIIQLTDKKEPQPEAFENVQKAIEDEIKRKKRSELFDALIRSLKDKYRVKIEEDAVKTFGEPGESAEAKKQ